MHVRFEEVFMRGPFGLNVEVALSTEVTCVAAEGAVDGFDELSEVEQTLVAIH